MNNKMDRAYFDAKFETLVVMIKDLKEDVRKINGRTAKNEENVHLLQLNEQECRAHRKKAVENMRFVRWTIVSLILTAVGAILFVTLM